MSKAKRRTTAGGGPALTPEQQRGLLLTFRETYNTTWLIERHGFMTPTAFGQKQLQPVDQAALGQFGVAAGGQFVIAGSPMVSTPRPAIRQSGNQFISMLALSMEMSWRIISI